MNYLLDTNVCIALINGTSSKVRARYVQADSPQSYAHNLFNRCS